MSFSLLSLSSSSPASNSFPLRNFPVSELSSPSSTTIRSQTYDYYCDASSTNSSPFNRTTVHSHFPSSSLPINSFSHLSSMSSGTHASHTADNLVDSSRSASATDELGVSDSDDDEIQLEHENHDSSLPDRWHVLGLGQAMVDFSGIVDDGFLDRLGLSKGTRKVVSHEERGRILRAMDGCSYKAAAGGSLSNTLVALARLGGPTVGRGPRLNIAMAGSVGNDPLAGFYRSKLLGANVEFLSAPLLDGTTGTVIVLTTPDAQRTMLAYQGTSSRVNYDPCLASLISKTSILIIEGYLFEFPDTIKTIAMACEEAHRCGALVAITASDVTCIERHYDDFWAIIANYADIIFANSDEARAFCLFPSKECPVSATRYLSHFVPFVSVTDGPKGSYIGVKGEAVYIPPSPCVPVDTCGAGDAYASGILYGLLRGVSDVRGMGKIASKVASVVVAQQGTRLRVQDAVQLAESFAFLHESSTMWPVILHTI